jgi:energy-coupling factor transporter ATP-binding protein EcfA2
VHAPGTVLNNQFGGTDPWESYISALESSSPVIEAIGVTDYYNTDTYERLCEAKAQGRLPDCALIFPNIEMRLALGTVKGSWVNLHLLVCPDNEDHVEQVKRFLGSLTFEAFEDRFSCTPAELTRLGYKAGAPAGQDRSALELGSTQFKVSFEQLKESFRAFGWAKENILVAVAGGNDGTSGLRDAADTTLRQEVEKFAHIIFASSPSQRDFWLGRKSANIERLWELYKGPKPCLHGSDAHSHAATGVPDEDRFSWIKGDPTFDALKQATIDPAGRAFVGNAPPVSAMPSQVLTSVTLENAPWALTPSLTLNPGLIAIIGARGSGKTALAEALAAGCDAVPPLEENHQAFLYRARNFLEETAVTVTWEGGEDEKRLLLDAADPANDQYPRARYLSQQFVDTLCAADGMTDHLLREVERVVFESHSVSDRDGAVDFADLLDLRATRFRQARLREEAAIANISERISTELEKDKLVAAYEGQVREKALLIQRHTLDRSKLIAKGSEAHVARLEEVTQAAEKVRSFVRFFNLQEQQLLTLQDEVTDVRSNQAPETLRDLRERHAQSGIKKDEEWEPFTLDYKGDVDHILVERLGAAKRNAQGWKGAPHGPIAQGDLTKPLIPDGVDLTQQPLGLLEAEMGRLQQIVSIDRATAEKFSQLSQRIVTETDLLERLKEKLEDAKGAKQRAKQLSDEREGTYARLFDAIIAEQTVLNELYAPIKARLAAEPGTLNKLAFSVNRSVDVGRWAEAGEALLDLRWQGPFKGKGTLLKVANETLKPAWETGSVADISAAMREFREKHQASLLEHSPVPKTDQVEFRAWSRRFAQWLYGTDHITVQYSVDYDGIDIRNLSPGTRGIVLLLLYLSLDSADDRPLIIDQPEENLDPKSIFDELVSLFSAAKSKRQVIMVTHNANLVVNADADQIIVASVGTHASGALPPITYETGGLEDAVIRRRVCDILEGGEAAFKERARRLRVRLER